MPAKSLTVLKTVANLGLLYATFIEALQADPNPISQTRIKTLCLSLFVFTLPFMCGYTLYWLFQKLVRHQLKSDGLTISPIYWGAAVTGTGFATLAPILSMHKLLCTRVGQEALLVGLFNSFCTTGLINITLAFSTSSNDDIMDIDITGTCYTLLFMVVYMLFCYMVIKPAISKMASYAPEGKNYSNYVVEMILFLVLACGLFMDYIGSHFIFGAYVLGRSIPPGILTRALIEKMEDCVNGVLLPLYFMVIGVKIDVIKLILNFKYTWVLALGVLAKLFSALLSGVLCNLPLADSLPLGVLLSAKGLLPLALLNIGYERGVSIIFIHTYTHIYHLMSLLDEPKIYSFWIH